MPTITRIPEMENVWGRQRTVGVSLTGDSSTYNTQAPTPLGYPLYPSNYGMKKITDVQVSGIGGTIADSGGLDTRADLVSLANSACIRFFYPTGGAGAVPAALAAPSAAGAVPAGSTAVESTSAQPTIDSAITPGIGIEVKAGTDLTKVTVNLRIIGI